VDLPAENTWQPPFLPGEPIPAPIFPGAKLRDRKPGIMIKTFWQTARLLRRFSTHFRIQTKCRSPFKAAAELCLRPTAHRCGN
jgi:hypothetical protein